MIETLEFDFTNVEFTYMGADGAIFYTFDNSIGVPNTMMLTGTTIDTLEIVEHTPFTMTNVHIVTTYEDFIVPKIYIGGDTTRGVIDIGRPLKANHTEISGDIWDDTWECDMYVSAEPMGELGTTLLIVIPKYGKK